MNIEFSILYAIQSIRTEWLDKAVVYMTSAMGKNAEIWLALGIGLMLFKKTRKMGITVIASYILSWIIGQDILKNLICRPRPCHIDEKIELLVSRPSSYSCPSTHTSLAFGMAVSVKAYDKKAGIYAIILALIVAFTRMYLFVHFPSDVLLGSIIGILSGYLSSKLIKLIFKK